jgi:murein DD-endopeptidase MepM/ murein hydrolase activator NlpD
MGNSKKKMFGEASIFMRWAVLLLITVGAQLAPALYGAIAMAQSRIYLSSRVIPQGDIALLKITADKGETPQVIWMNREIYLLSDQQETDWYAFLGADLRAKPGQYKILIKFPASGHEEQLEIEIRKKDYGVRNLTLPKNMVDLDPKTLERAREESRTMKGLWEASPSAPLWSGPFLRPVPGEVVGPFGQRSVINNQPRAPHSGVDLKGERGAPIRTINHGQVALCSDHFFSGLSVVIDHGGGVQSMYFHLERILVQQGQMVRKGDVIGLVGSSGRATAPHLHWGIRMNGARIDPLQLILLSRELEG